MKTALKIAVLAENTAAGRGIRGEHAGGPARKNDALDSILTQRGRGSVEWVYL